MARRIPVVGLAGGIGAGKSEVARILESMGAAIIDSDAINRQELERPEVRETLVRWWGPQILRPDGSVDRGRVADIVFADRAEKSRLEALMHPRIAIRREELMTAYRREGSVRLILLNAPLLFEAGLDGLCDAILFVDAPTEIRAARTTAQRGWGRAEFDRREKMQWPLDLKKARSDYICNNSSDVTELRQHVASLLARLLSDVESGG